MICLIFLGRVYSLYIPSLHSPIVTGGIYLAGAIRLRDQNSPAVILVTNIADTNRSEDSIVTRTLPCMLGRWVLSQVRPTHVRLVTGLWVRKSREL